MEDDNTDEIRTGYIYGLFASDQPVLLWECRYIGKTIQTLQDRLDFHLWEATQDDKRAYRQNWIRSVWSRGADVVMRPLETYGPEPKFSLNATLFLREKIWIAEGRRQGWRLTNSTDGGEGCHGMIVAPETGAKISAAKMGHEVSEETRAKIRANNAQSAKTHCPQGHEYNEENTLIRPNGGRSCRLCARDAARKRRGYPRPSLKGIPRSEEVKAKISATQKGREFTQEHKDALSVAGLAKRSTHCPQGHEYTEENTSISVGVNGREHISCKLCNRIRAREKYRRDHPGSKHYNVD